MMWAPLFYAILVFSASASPISQPVTRSDCYYDVIIYDSTPAAISAAIQVTRMGKSVAIVTPQWHVGGLTVSGLGWTDSKNGSALGGITREFYHRIYQYYLNDAAWYEQDRASYISENITAQPGPAIEPIRQLQWTFEPHVAQQIFNDWLKEYNIPIYYNEWLERSNGCGVQKTNGTISSFKTLSGTYYSAKMFIDAGYNGDLMAEANVTWTIGREAESTYNEPLAGVSYQNSTTWKGVDPWNTPGQPSSGLIPGISRIIPNPTGINGTADPLRLQSYNYRVALTQVPSLKIPFTKPSDYNESNYEILFRYAATNPSGLWFTQQFMPNNKTDTNANGLVSTDYVGANFDQIDNTNYGEWSYDRRQLVAQQHKSWMQGFFWTLANHPRIPAGTRNATSIWGYSNDEWTDNGNWPYELYIRESRRMKGSYVMTQLDVQNSTVSKFGNDSIVGLGSYRLDTHVVERCVTGSAINQEGSVGDITFLGTPFVLPYDSIIPYESDATNFLNPVTMSASHTAYAAIRLEPTYMILGQSAATAAVMAIEQGVSVQNINRTMLTQRLLQDSQFLAWPSPVV